MEPDARYRQFIEVINSIIISLDREGCTTFFNNFSEKLFGYNRDEILGKQIFGKIFPFRDFSGKANVPEYEQIIADPARYYQNESEGLCKDGSRLRISWSATALRDRSGKVTGILIDGNDSTGLYRERKEASERSAILNALLESIPEGIMITDADQVVKQVSRSIGNLLGVSPERILNSDEPARLKMLDLYWPDGRKLEKPGDLPLSKTLTTGEPFTDLEVIARCDGDQKTLSISAAPIRNSHGAMLGAVGIWHDITKRKRLIRHLEDERNFVNAVIQTSGALIAVIDKDGKISRFNKACEDLTGYTVDEVRGHILFDLFILPEERDNVLNVASRLFAGETTVDYENHWVTKSGEKRFIHWRNSIMLDVSGVPIFAVATGIDITDQRKAEAALQESRERFEAAFRSIQDALIISDMETGTILEANETWVSHWGYSLTETIGHRSTELGFYTDIGDRERALQIVRKEGRLADFEILLRTKTGELRNAVFFIEELKISSKSLMLTIIHDSTERKKAEQAILESEAMFRTMFQSHGAVMLLIEPDSGKIVDANTAAEDFYGYSHDELRNMRIQQINQDRTDKIASEIHKAVDRTRTIFEFNHKISSGQVRTVEVYSSPVQLTDKKLLFSIIHDITERNQLKKQLEGERDFVNAVIQTSGALIVVLDRDGRITRFNQACQDLTGYTADEVIGHILFELFILREERENVISIAMRLLGGERKVENENHWVTKSGEKRYIRWRNSIMTNEVGVPMYVIATGIDITDRNRAEKELRESEASLRHVQEIARLGSWELDLTANRLTWSDEIYRIFGLQPQEFSATYEAFLDRVHPEDRAAVNDAYSDSLQEDRDSYEIDHRVVRKDNGEIRYVHEKCQHVRDSQGKIVRSLGMVHDITERKNAEEQIRQKVVLLEKANRDLERFNRIAVGREMRMIGLKREINSLCVRLGEPLRYSLQFADEEKI